MRIQPFIGHGAVDKGIIKEGPEDKNLIVIIIVVVVLLTVATRGIILQS